VKASSCAICGDGAGADVLYPERLPANGLSADQFSARRAPDRVHGRFMRCRNCGLTYAAHIPDADELAALYGASHFTYEDELPNLRRSYGRCLRRVAAVRADTDDFLEIGCGNGFMLEEALAQGYRSVRGVEPSGESIARASPHVRPFIHHGMFDGRAFAPASIGVVAAFQVLDHLANPGQFLADARAILRPGGAVLIVVHDASAWSVRLLGERSPIFDVAHPYLYDRGTLRRLLERAGLVVQDMFSVWNTYSLRYWLRLSPLPVRLKTALVAGMGPAANVRVAIAAGNLGVIAQRPIAA